jgi:magnesium-transporting ATPase (P-type)
VERKRRQYGSNETSEKINHIRKFLSYFWGSITWMIEAAAVLSVALQHWEDFAMIFNLLIVNAVVEFWQEHKADNAVELLRKRTAPKARQYPFLHCKKHSIFRRANSCLLNLHRTSWLGNSWPCLGLRAA